VIHSIVIHWSDSIDRLFTGVIHSIVIHGSDSIDRLFTGVIHSIVIHGSDSSSGSFCAEGLEGRGDLHVDVLGRHAMQHSPESPAKTKV
jgi:hypothetical protein